MSRIGAAVGTFLLPLSLAHLGNRWSMLFGALVLLVGLVVSVAWAPETRRTPLDESYQPAQSALTVENA
jgi:putative MFS transporter